MLLAATVTALAWANIDPSGYAAAAGPARRSAGRPSPGLSHSGLVISLTAPVPGRSRPRLVAIFEIVGTLMLNGGVTMAARLGFTEADVRAAAGRQSFERGLGYLGAVAGLEAVGDQWVATVRGSEDYLVVLTPAAGHAVVGGRVRGECDCPYGQEGFFCKHCVAVGLTVVRGAARVPEQRARGGRGRGASPRAASASKAGPGDLEAWVGARSRDELLALVYDHLLEDDDWRRRLELRAASAALDLPEVRARAAGLLDADAGVGQYRYTGQYGYIEGAECWRYARRIRDVTAVVEELARSGNASEAVAVAEQALTAIAESSRDASDRAGVIEAAAAELVASHQAAYQIAAPDPVRLAAFLAGRLLSGGDVPPVDLADYTGPLGQAGLAELRDLITAAWAARPSGWPERRAMEQVLTAAGDVDALVEFISAEPGEPGGGQLQIALALEQAGRPEEALAWAERGLREPAGPQAGLADYVVQRYRSAGRLADAADVRRGLFAASRSLAAYQELREAAEEAGSWPATRKWALGLLRADHDAGTATAAGSASSRQRAPQPVLIDVLLDEGGITAAWAAAPGTASDAQWLRLADLVIETRPADALVVYLRLIEALRRQAGDGVYERMAQLLVSARECHDRLGTRPAFDAYLRALREDQKRKRRLIRVLDAHQL